MLSALTSLPPVTVLSHSAFKSLNVYFTSSCLPHIPPSPSNLWKVNPVSSGTAQGCGADAGPKPNSEHSAHLASATLPGSSTGGDEEARGPTALPEPPSTPTSGSGEGSGSPCLHPNPDTAFPRDKGCHSAYGRGSLFIKGRNLRCSSEIIILGRKSCFRCAHVAVSQHQRYY